MPTRPSNPKKRPSPKDTNLLAHRIVADAVGESPPEPPSEKNPAAVALGKLGGSKGGKARAANLTPEERKAAARKAARARWGKPKESER